MNFTPPKLLDRAVSSGLLSACLLFLLVGTTAHAQEITGTPGAPDATTTIDGHVLPPPPQPFERRDRTQRRAVEAVLAGARRAAEGRAEHPADHDRRRRLRRAVAPSAASSRRRRSTASPTDGLRYTNFHSTSLCSPTRAALITGRNHHSVGFGVVSEQSTGFPGYNSIIGKDSATIGRILLENGYRTSWFGKDHNTPTYQASQAGPFDQWPTGMGFEYFYGFVGGDTSQWQPNLFRNTTAIYPYVGNPSWNLTTAMADDAIHWMNQLNDIDPVDAVLRLLRARRHARAAPPDAGMDQEDQRHASVRQGLERAARPDLRQPEEARRDPAGRQADALAG